MTRGDLKTMVVRWVRESVPDLMLNDAVNDAVQFLWRELMQIQISMFTQGPTSITLASGTERTAIVSITDPVAAPTINLVAGGALSGGRTIQAQFTYVTDSGSETLPSPVTSSVAPGANKLASIPPPAAVAGAMGWNLYAADVNSDGQIGKQNPAPLSFNQTYIEPITGFINGDNPPSANTTADNVAYIRQLEIVQADGTVRPYQQMEIDSLLMQRMSRIIASTSEYQSYAFDFVNQNTIEVRPKMGSTLSPRYFWVVKPRTLAFDSSLIPFITIDPTEYLKSKCVADIALANHEYVSAQMWEAKADRALFSLKGSVAKQNFGKNNYVTPYMRY